MGLVTRICDHVVVLDAGAVIARGRPEEVLRDPWVMAAYLGEDKSSMLEVRGITVSYGAIEALTDVSLRVDAGDWVAILGSNGAGKSTLLRTISGLLRPTAGDILIKDASTLKQSLEAIVRLGVAHVPEGRGISPI